jgi:transcriptional regulator with XRE-family HTH domain
MTFAAQLKTARLAAGLTQAELAELIGVTRLTVSKWERGESSPPPEPIPSQSEILSKIPAPKGR